MQVLSQGRGANLWPSTSGKQLPLAGGTHHRNSRPLDVRSSRIWCLPSDGFASMPAASKACLQGGGATLLAKQQVALPAEFCQCSPGACLQVVLAHAAEFLQANAASLDLTPTSAKYAFKWLQLADLAGLTDACKACADRIVALDRSSCVSANLQGLSPQTLMYLLDRVATTSSAHSTGYPVGSSAYSGAAGAGAYLDVGHDVFGIGCGFAHYVFDECYRCARTRAVRTRATYTREGGVRMLRICDDCGR
jgi:hypothetical protein